MPNFTSPRLAVGLLSIACLASAQSTGEFTGTIADNACGASGHAHMRMGANDRECVLACIDAHGATYVLDTGREVYTLSDQKTPERFAARRVTVTGTLDAKSRTIRVQSIAPAK
jgi:hypothetical protein